MYEQVASSAQTSKRRAAVSEGRNRVERQSVNTPRSGDLNLARPFKAGNRTPTNLSFRRVATGEFRRRYATESCWLTAAAALKGRPKFIRPLRGRPFREVSGLAPFRKLVMYPEGKKANARGETPAIRVRRRSGETIKKGPAGDGFRSFRTFEAQA
jgi:hypothetical protein